MKYQPDASLVTLGLLVLVPNAFAGDAHAQGPTALWMLLRGELITGWGSARPPKGSRLLPLPTTPSSFVAYLD